ncbi:hypothetical protein RJ639_037508 [Escallonia herrerae]|uniref:RNase H type-1 domain-containing protein n=1 Tax=Escallonia herrerae TaxID=1293975 RepID=A0AA88WKZ6_9ASTE|nr:hypothetical protein RJ639_037508 [Escallonia herrerae]
MAKYIGWEGGNGGRYSVDSKEQVKLKIMGWPVDTTVVYIQNSIATNRYTLDNNVFPRGCIENPDSDEVTAAFQACQFAWKAGFWNIQLEGDSANVVAAMNKKATDDFSAIRNIPPHEGIKDKYICIGPLPGMLFNGLASVDSIS